MTNTASIDGTLLAGSLTQNGELHSYAYDGTLPDGGAPVPEPPTMIVLGAGLLGLGFLRRRMG